MAGQIILVSNRLPVTVTKTGGRVELTVSNGGLPSAMASLIGENDVMWVGWPGIAAEDLSVNDKRQITRELAKLHCVPIYLTRQQIANYYEGFSNATLWPLFHYFPQYSVHRDVYWAEYRKINQLFARTVSKLAQPDSTIWIHDYHLMTLPKLLRGDLPSATIGFFLHIPFPSYEIFRQLPQRRDIVSGLLGADLVGFHVYDYAVHFTHSVQRLLGYESNLGTIVLKDRLVHVDAFPLGINYQQYAGAIATPQVKAEITRLRKHFRQTKIILSMDRLDYSKGIPSRLEAYGAFLERNPQYIGKVTLAMVAVPSRTEVEAYKQLKDQVEQTVSRINGRFGSVDWTPISYQYKNLPFEQIVALYAEAKIALVTPLRDGMNLIAKEYLAAKQSNSGVLIISEMAGAVDELPEAIRVNPNDQAAMVRAIEKALAMPLVQQRRKLRIMQSRISKYTVQRWSEDFLQQLQTAHSHQNRRTLPLLVRRDREEFMQAYRNAKRRLILLDYDGTLTEFVPTPDPNAARLTPRRRAMLMKLAGQPGNHVAVISGRPRGALENWFGNSAITLSAEHGAWIKQAGQWTATTAADRNWQDAVLPVLLNTAERTPGSGVEIKDYALVWHYRNVTPDLAYIRNAQLHHDLDEILAGTAVRVFEGNKIYEIKPESITKGAATKTFANADQYDFIMAIGDDYTDEDMFANLPATAYTLKVGVGESRARYQIAGVEAVIKLLADLAKI